MRRLGIDPRPLTTRLTLLTVAAGLVLVGLGVASIAAPGVAARLFGVPAAGDLPFVTVAGVRDLAAGVLVVAFALLGDRRAVGACVLVGSLIPIGDGSVVLWHGPAPLLFVAMHWGSAVACVAFAAVLLRGGRAAQTGS